MKSILGKTLAIFGLLILAAPALFAESTAPRTLMDLEDLSFSGYGGPIFRVADIGGEPGFMFGGRGGMIINDSFVLGLGGCGLAYSEKKALIEGEERRVELGYGGLLVEYYFFPKNLVLFSVGTLVGWGGIGTNLDSEADYQSFFVVEPEANVFINVTRYFRFGIGTAYRFTQGIDVGGFDDEDLRGFSGTLLFNFGWF